MPKPDKLEIGSPLLTRKNGLIIFQNDDHNSLEPIESMRDPANFMINGEDQRKSQISSYLTNNGYNKKNIYQATTDLKRLKSIQLGIKYEENESLSSKEDEAIKNYYLLLEKRQKFCIKLKKSGKKLGELQSECLNLLEERKTFLETLSNALKANPEECHTLRKHLEKTNTAFIPERDFKGEIEVEKSNFSVIETQLLDMNNTLSSIRKKIEGIEQQSHKLDDDGKKDFCTNFKQNDCLWPNSPALKRNDSFFRSKLPPVNKIFQSINSEKTDNIPPSPAGSTSFTA